MTIEHPEPTRRDARPSAQTPMRMPLARCAVAGCISGALASSLGADRSASWLAPGVPDMDLTLLHAVPALLAGSVAFRAVARAGRSGALPSFSLGFAGATLAHVFLAGREATFSGTSAVIAATVIAALLAFLAIGFPLPARGASLRAHWIEGLLGVLAIAIAARMRSAGDALQWSGACAPESSATLLAAAAGWTALGACAAWPFLRHGALPRAVVLGVSALALAATWDAHSVAQRFGEREPLERYLSAAPWNVSFDALHSPLADLLIAARVFALPALALGALLTLAQSSARYAWIAGGVALGAALPLRAPSTDLLHDPRALAPVAVVRSIETRFGRVTVEERDGQRVACLERSRWTALGDELEAEERMFARLSGARRVLLVGVVTPERQRALQAVGVERVDCSAPFYEALREVVDALYVPSDLDPAELRLLSPEEAEQAVLAGEYDAVCVAPIEGLVPSVVPPLVPPTTTFIAWFDAAEPIAQCAWPPRVQVCVADLERIYVGLGSDGELPAGEALAARSALELAFETREQRMRVNTRRVAERLASAARNDQHSPSARGLALHFAAQIPSSPYESRAERIELDDRALAVWVSDLSQREPARFERDLFEGLARTLIGKRDLERIERDVEPIARRYAPWPELEHVLAQADIEMLDPTGAAARLARVLELRPGDVESALLRARCLLATERAPEAVAQLERLPAPHASRFDVRRELAIARVRAGDPRGAMAVAELLALEPDDAVLRAHQGPGPYPALAPSVR